MEIRNWLQGKRDYGQGRRLYEKHSRNAVLQKLFALGPSVYNVSKLAAELEKLQEPDPEAPAVPAPATPPAPPAHSAVAEGVLKQLRPLLAEQAAIQAQLDMPQSDKERYGRAHRVMQLAGQIEPLWRAYHHAKEHGTLPTPKAKKLPQTEAEQIRRLNNLRTYRTRYRDRPERLAEIVEEIKQIEELLHGKQ